MLDRIRTALGRQEANDLESRLTQLPAARLEGVMPPIAPEARIAKFEAELRLVSGGPHRASSRVELEGILDAIFQGAESRAAVLTRNPIIRELHLAETLRARGITVAEWPASTSANSLGAPGEEFVAFRNECFSAGVGISGVDCVLAETGSLILSSETEGAQLASLAPPIHVALYRREQVVSSLDDALAILSPFAAAARREVQPATAVGALKSAAGRSIVFITGTSRTADIEQTLIRGVHGPRDVHAILVEDACLAEFRAASSAGLQPGLSVPKAAATKLDAGLKAGSTNRGQR